MSIYVGNLSYEVTQEDLTSVFAEYGSVKRVQLPTDHETGRMRGFGFIEMGSDAEEEKAIAELDGAEWLGREIGVTRADDARAWELQEHFVFDVVLTKVPPDRENSVLEIVRRLTGLSLQESKDVIEGIKAVKESVTRDDAKAAKKALEDAGAEVIISAQFTNESRAYIESPEFNGSIASINTKIMIENLDKMLDELVSTDFHIAMNQVSIDSLKIETKEMLVKLQATID
jgi:RNA recognition motif-containing protein